MPGSRVESNRQFDQKLTSHDYLTGINKADLKTDILNKTVLKFHQSSPLPLRLRGGGDNSQQRDNSDSDQGTDSPLVVVQRKKRKFISESPYKPTDVSDQYDKVRFCLEQIDKTKAN